MRVCTCVCVCVCTRAFARLCVITCIRVHVRVHARVRLIVSVYACEHPRVCGIVRVLHQQTVGLAVTSFLKLLLVEVLLYVALYGGRVG